MSVLLVGCAGAGTSTAKPSVPPALSTVTQPDVDVLLAIGSGGYPDPFSPSESEGGGGDDTAIAVTFAADANCAMCAQMSWSVAVALSGFGSFHSLTIVDTSSRTPALDLTGGYSSSYLRFHTESAADHGPTVEIDDRTAAWPETEPSPLRGLAATAISAQLVH